MKIFLATLGSRGDFEPFLNFAIEAKAKGHEVIIAATTEFAEQASAIGVECIVLSGSFMDLVQDTGVSVIRAMKEFRTTVKPVMVAALNKVSSEILERKPDVVLYHPKVLSAPMAAKKIGAISVVVELAPLITPTREFGAAGVGTGNLGPFNKLSYKLVAKSSSLFSKDLESISKSLGVPVKSADYSVCLVSPSLLEKPKDWTEKTQIVGPWVNNSRVKSENSKIIKFLESAPTIYFGFGSMVSGDATRRTEIAIAAAKAVGMQALIVTGWGGLEEVESADGVLTVQSVNHAEVFSKVAVAVHHGGAGTVHSALRSGVPSVVVPFIADQPWWGALLERRGLGPKPLPNSKVSVKSLSQAINSALAFAPAVQHLSIAMNKEDGVSETLSFLVQWNERNI